MPRGAGKLRLQRDREAAARLSSLGASSYEPFNAPDFVILFLMHSNLSTLIPAVNNCVCLQLASRALRSRILIFCCVTSEL